MVGAIESRLRRRISASDEFAAFWRLDATRIHRYSASKHFIKGLKGQEEHEMKGIYILFALVAGIGVLGYLVMKPTDSDIRRKADTLRQAMDLLEEQLNEVQPLLIELRSLKRRTFLLDGEYDHLREKTGKLRLRLNAAVHDLDDLNEQIRRVTQAAFESMTKDLEQLLSRSGNFVAKVTALRDLLVEVNPKLTRMDQLQARINALAEERNGSGRPLNAALMKDVESYNIQCKTIRDQVTQALKIIHQDLNNGLTMGKTALNSARQLIPTLEAFIKDLAGS